jgi:hypothetical protein
LQMEVRGECRYTRVSGRGVVRDCGSHANLQRAASSGEVVQRIGTAKRRALLGGQGRRNGCKEIRRKGSGGLTYRILIVRLCHMASFIELVVVHVFEKAFDKSIELFLNEILEIRNLIEANTRADLKAAIDTTGDAISLDPVNRRLQLNQVILEYNKAIRRLDNHEDSTVGKIAARFGKVLAYTILEEKAKADEELDKVEEEIQQFHEMIRSFMHPRKSFEHIVVSYKINIRATIKNCNPIRYISRIKNDIFNNKYHLVIIDMFNTLDLNRPNYFYRSSLIDYIYRLDKVYWLDSWDTLSEFRKAAMKLKAGPLARC